MSQRLQRLACAGCRHTMQRSWQPGLRLHPSVAHALSLSFLDVFSDDRAQMLGSPLTYGAHAGTHRPSEVVPGRTTSTCRRALLSIRLEDPQTSWTSPTLVVEVKPYFTVETVKDAITLKTGIARDLQLLTCEGKRIVVSYNEIYALLHAAGGPIRVESSRSGRELARAILAALPIAPKAIKPSEIPPRQSRADAQKACDKTLKAAFNVSCGKGLHIDKLWHMVQGCTVAHELATTLIFAVCQRALQVIDEADTLAFDDDRN
ncbi:hypothetical protein T492DRAFT_865619 [Pavlovales sp. CCMP2436]|nr:hypothetical protein T492DRAFT_865619 [Pavlovales sp. CCMP2436]